MYWLTIVGCCFSTARKLYSDEKSKLMNKQATPQHQHQQQENPKPRQANVPVNASPLGPLKKEVRLSDRDAIHTNPIPHIPPP